MIGVDDFIASQGRDHYRYVDDTYILFETSDEFRAFFPRFVKKLRDYDLSLNESKTFATAPAKLVREEAELDKAITKAKAEAKDKLTDYVEIEIEGEYGNESFTEIIETTPDEKEVDFVATAEIFDNLDDFKGDERDRAEAFCLTFFRRASDPVAVPYVVKRWGRNPDKAREYALYLNRFINDDKVRAKIDATFVETAEQMIDFQWAWASLISRRMKKVSAEYLAVAIKVRNDALGTRSYDRYSRI